MFEWKARRNIRLELRRDRKRAFSIRQEQLTKQHKKAETNVQTNDQKVNWSNLVS